MTSSTGERFGRARLRPSRGSRSDPIENGSDGASPSRFAPRGVAGTGWILAREGRGGDNARRGSARMSFHLGKPILVMLVLAVVCAAGLALRPGKHDRPDLLVWVFADIHLKTYQGDGRPTTQPTLVEQYRRRTGKRVGIELVATRSEDVRLVSMFMSDSREVPDVVELEISSVAKYFRPPTRDVGLLPLNDFLTRSGWMDKVLAARLAPWSKNGVIFGVPHDVHPVTLVYRDDLFREAGIDLPAMKTWPAFRAGCLKFQDFWRARGGKNRNAFGK